jgi:hypothetical protein
MGIWPNSNSQQSLNSHSEFQNVMQGDVSIGDIIPSISEI